MRILDRYVVKSFLFNYLLALGVILGMYTLLDLIVNFDRFAKGATDVGETGALALAADIGNYYAYQSLVIFQQVSGIVPLLAAGFTMVRMTRHSELTAMLASGVSLYRVAAPIVVCSIAFSLLAVADQELIMPACADKLMRKHEEVNQTVKSAQPLQFVQDYNNLVLATSYNPDKQQMTDVRILWRDKDGTVVRRDMADVATWKTALAAGNAPGGWLLEGNAREIDDKGDDPVNRVVTTTDTLTYTTGLEPKQIELVLSKKAVEFLSSAQIQTLIRNSPEATKPNLEKVMHIRFTGPLMNLVMLLLGIPFLLTREPGRLIRNMFYCVIVTGVCFAATFVSFQMSGQFLPPLLGAWLPVLVFGPLAVAMLDAIRT